MAFTLSQTSALASGTISTKTGYSLLLQRQTQDISLLRLFQLSDIALQPYQSIQCVRTHLCVRACVCVRACIRVCVCVCIFLSYSYALLMSTLCVSFLLNWWYHFPSRCALCVLCLFSVLSRGVGALHISIIILLLKSNCYIWSISMYIMCVILCLFSALSRRVGALRISISSIIKANRYEYTLS